MQHFCNACREGTVDVVKKRLENNADPNYTCEVGHITTHIYIQVMHTEMSSVGVRVDYAHVCCQLWPFGHSQSSTQA